MFGDIKVNYWTKWFYCTKTIKNNAIKEPLMCKKYYELMICLELVCKPLRENASFCGHNSLHKRRRNMANFVFVLRGSLAFPESFYHHVFILLIQPFHPLGGRNLSLLNLGHKWMIESPRICQLNSCWIRLNHIRGYLHFQQHTGNSWELHSAQVQFEYNLAKFLTKLWLFF